MRSQFQQPLSAELLSQQQQMIKQLQLHQASQAAGGLSINSPKRVELNPNNRQQLLTQTIIHQTYGVQPQAPLPQAHILAQYQSQQQATNLQLRQLSASSVIPSNFSPPIPGATGVGAAQNRNLACLQMSYYSQSPHFGETLNSAQVICIFMSLAVVASLMSISSSRVKVQQPPTEPRFPPAISVNRLAPQVSSRNYFVR